MTIVSNSKVVLAVLGLIFVLPSLGFGANLSHLEEKLLARDRVGVHTELQKLFREEREVFDEVINFTDPILNVFEAFDKLKEFHLMNGSDSEKLLIERLNSEWQNI